jgi:signal peptidase I
MTVLIIVLVAGYLISFAVNAGLLALTCKLCRAPIRYRWALLTVGVLVLLNAGAGVALLILPIKLTDLPLPVLIVMSLALLLLLPLASILAILRLRVGKAVLVTLGWQVLTTLYTIGCLFLLKAFLFEAFFSPSGNMAETLLGFHKDVTCPSCGLKFPVNAADEAEPPGGLPPMVVNGCTCPNCRLVIRLVDSGRDGRSPKEGLQHDDNGDFVEIADPGVTGGDRFLISKGLLLGKEFPERMDIVAFKYPKRQDINFIKRVIGFPGEIIAIHGGDLYRLSPANSPQHHDQVSSEEIWKQEFMHLDDPAVKQLWEDGKFELLRNSPEQVLTRMVLAHDSDHQATDLKGKEWQRWQPTSDAWETQKDGRAFSHTARGGAAEDWLQYRHLLRGQNHKPALITDFMGYNSGESLGPNAFPAGPFAKWRPQNWVGDLILECDVTVEKAEGKFLLELVAGGERFRAVFDLTSQECQLQRFAADGKLENLGTKPANLSGGAHRVRLANVDRRLIVWIDDRLPFGEGIECKVGKRVPTALDLTPARVGAQGGELTIRKLRLFRDSYYSISATSSDVQVEDWSDPRRWESLKALPVRTMFVQPGHYLVLGDNPSASSDSRDWGVVPERLLLGKAAFVYYPWSRARPLR